MQQFLKFGATVMMNEPIRKRAKSNALLCEILCACAEFSFTGTEEKLNFRAYPSDSPKIARSI